MKSGNFQNFTIFMIVANPTNHIFVQTIQVKGVSRSRVSKTTPNGGKQFESIQTRNKANENVEIGCKKLMAEGSYSAIHVEWMGCPTNRQIYQSVFMAQLSSAQYIPKWRLAKRVGFAVVRWRKFYLWLSPRRLSPHDCLFLPGLTRAVAVGGLFRSIYETSRLLAD